MRCTSRGPSGVPRVVLDTNVLVSALISPGGPSAAVLLELRAGAFELVTSPLLVEELADVLGRPKLRAYVSEQEAAAFVELVRTEATLLDDPTPSGLALTSDPDDEFLVDLARAASADVLVSGDGHVLALRGALPVMSPSEFLSHLTGGA
jgi:putative PIN family toxin of toxin-antitoxin system